MARNATLTLEVLGKTIKSASPRTAVQTGAKYAAAIQMVLPACAPSATATVIALDVPRDIPQAMVGASKI